MQTEQFSTLGRSAKVRVGPEYTCGDERYNCMYPNIITNIRVKENTLSDGCFDAVDMRLLQNFSYEYRYTNCVRDRLYGRTCSPFCTHFAKYHINPPNICHPDETVQCRVCISIARKYTKGAVTSRNIFRG